MELAGISDLFNLIKDYLNRAAYLFSQEGPASLLKKFISTYIFCSRTLYLRQHFSADLKEEDYRPECEEFSFQLFTSNAEADEWAQKTGFDFRRQILHGRKRLDSGAVAFCIFVQNRLVSINCVALTACSKKIINPLPFKVDFEHGQACTSGAETVPAFRSKGLLTYNWFQRNEFMKKQGLTALIGTYVTTNWPVLKAHSRFPCRVYARARHIRFLWWQYWKETSLPEGFKPPQDSKS